MNIKEIVRKLKSRYKTEDPFQIAERMGVTVFSGSLGNILGYHNESRRVRMIHINCELNAHLRRFVCAHELGHVVLHPGLNTPFLRQNTLFSIDKIEREANEFAVEIIMSDEDLCELRGSCVTIYEAASIYGVPQELAYLKKLDEVREGGGRR